MPAIVQPCTACDTQQLESKIVITEYNQTTLSFRQLRCTVQVCIKNRKLIWESWNNINIQCHTNTIATFGNVVTCLTFLPGQIKTLQLSLNFFDFYVFIVFMVPQPTSRFVNHSLYTRVINLFYTSVHLQYYLYSDNRLLDTQPGIRVPLLLSIRNIRVRIIIGPGGFRGCEAGHCFH